MNMGYTAAGWTYLADEHHIYGSSRVGVHNTHFVLAKRFSTAEMEYTQKTGNQIHFIRGKRNYELSNHLGNVQVVISDKRISVCDNELQTERFEADILMATDYYPFGMAIPERQWYTGSDSSNYRFGFNGQEKDNEAKGPGNSLDFGARIYDSRLGRWHAVDPHSKDYTPISPFCYVLNNPTYFRDVQGQFVVGVNGEKLSYKYIEGQLVIVGVPDEATNKLFSAMLKTPDGQEAIRFYIDLRYPVVFQESNRETLGDAHGETKEVDENGNDINKLGGGEFDHFLVLFTTEKSKNGKERMTTWSDDEILNAVGVHERWHIRKNGITRDHDHKKNGPTLKNELSSRFQYSALNLEKSSDIVNWIGNYDEKLGQKKVDKIFNKTIKKMLKNNQITEEQANGIKEQYKKARESTKNSNDKNTSQNN